MSDCKFCRTAPNAGEDPVCATLAQAYERTAVRPYGCPWFGEDDKERYPKPSPASPAITVSDEMIERAAISDYTFDGRGDWSKSSRVDRERYTARSRAALTAALEAGAVELKAMRNALMEIRSIANGSGNPRSNLDKIYGVATRACRSEPVSRHERVGG